MNKTNDNNVTEILARFSATVKYDEIPKRIIECSKKLLLDALACALAGHQGDETQQIRELSSALAQSKESSIIGGDRLSLAGATLFNGYLVTAVTMCDVHRPTFTHVTPEVVPPALAIAERDSLSGKELLVALTVGFETTTRIGLGLDYPAFRARGFHGPGVIGPFGAAAAVGRLLCFDPKTMAIAFGLSGSQAAGTYAALNTPTVKFHQCRGALSGLMAALLAQQGFVATRQFLTASDGGLYNSYSNGGCPETVTKNLGDYWELENIALRLWPSANVLQGLITAMFDLIELHKVNINNINKLILFLSKSAFERYGGFFKPKGKFDAFLSPHYIAAVLLHERQLSLDQFKPVHYNDQKLLQFASDKIEVKPDPTLASVQARVEAEKTSGSVISVQCNAPKGAPENQLSLAHIEDKFRAYANTRLSDSRGEEVIDLLSPLEELQSVQRLMNLLRII